MRLILFLLLATLCSCSPEPTYFAPQLVEQLHGKAQHVKHRGSDVIFTNGYRHKREFMPCAPSQRIFGVKLCLTNARS